MSYIIRRFEDADQDEVKTLYRRIVSENLQLYYRPLSGPQLPDDVRKNFSHPRDVFFIVEAAEKIIGLCAVRTHTDDPDVASMMNAVLLEEYRGLGIYREMFDIRIKHALEKGIKKLEGITSAHNRQMIEFLKKQGFETYIPAKAIDGFVHLRKNID